MNKLFITMISASLLAVTFSTYAADVNLDDMYHYENFSAYEIVLSSSPRRNIDVALDDMYRYDDFEAYNSNPAHLNSDEIASSSVISPTTKTTGDVALYHTY